MSSLTGSVSRLGIFVSWLLAILCVVIAFTDGMFGMFLVYSVAVTLRGARDKEINRHVFATVWGRREMLTYYMVFLLVILVRMDLLYSIDEWVFIALAVMPVAAGLLIMDGYYVLTGNELWISSDDEW